MKNNMNMTQEEIEAIVRTFRCLHPDAHICPKCGQYMIIPGYLCLGCGYDERDNEQGEI